MSTRRIRWVAALVGVVAVAAACTSPTAPKAAPLIECAQLGGDITYTPPATDSGEDITIATEPGFGLRDCTDRTGAGITSAELDLSALLPGYLCEPLDVGEPIGAGTGLIRWSDGSTSTVSAEVFGGSARAFVTELTITAGRWSGARGTTTTFVTSANGYCTPAAPVSRASLDADHPVAFVAPVAPILPPRTDLATIDTGSGGTTCSVMVDRTATCWGDNSSGQLGNALLAPGAKTSLPVPVTGITNAAQVSVGGDHVCALLTTGKIRCWGSNSNGQLGNGTTVDSNSPVTVLGIADAVQVSAGYRRTCARLADDTVRCWGQGAGTGGIDDPTPVAIGGLTGVVQLTAGSWHHCALLADGSVRCWGGNQFGQLGDGTMTDALYPVAVSGSLPAVTPITAGSEHTCALDTSGEVWCWGFNGYGQLGQSSSPSVPVTTPTRAIGNLAATAIDAGSVNTCALVVGGSVSCWGNNSNGELGIGTTTSTFQPMLVLGLRGATAVSAGGAACAMLRGGRADCWGDNFSGQLGNGRTTDSAVPVAVIDP